MPVHQMSCAYPLMVTSHSDRIIHIWNLDKCFKTNTFDPTEVFGSPLGFATSAIECFADGKGYAVGSIEGRCGIKFFDYTKTVQDTSLDYCFKCHRKEDLMAKKGTVWAVNGFSFCQKYGTMMSYGSDGTFTTWNV